MACPNVGELRWCALVGFVDRAAFSRLAARDRSSTRWRCRCCGSHHTHVESPFSIDSQRGKKQLNLRYELVPVSFIHATAGPGTSCDAVDFLIQWNKVVCL